jgi:hypothetical protein
MSVKVDKLQKDINEMKESQEKMKESLQNDMKENQEKLQKDMSEIKLMLVKMKYTR